MRQSGFEKDRIGPVLTVQQGIVAERRAERPHTFVSFREMRCVTRQRIRATGTSELDLSLRTI